MTEQWKAEGITSTCSVFNPHHSLFGLETFKPYVFKSPAQAAEMLVSQLAVTEKIRHTYYLLNYILSRKRFNRSKHNKVIRKIKLQVGRAACVFSRVLAQADGPSVPWTSSQPELGRGNARAARVAYLTSAVRAVSRSTVSTR